MKRICAFLASAIVFLLVFNVGAQETEHHFYIKRNKEHRAPGTDTVFGAYFDDDCFYFDRAAAKEQEKKIYLTFDAGYENGNVAKILDILKEENVPGAFFVLAHLIKSSPDLIERMRSEGHLICNHTASHKNMAKCSKEVFRAELTALEKIYTQATGAQLARFYRPPEGTFSISNLQSSKEMGYKTVFWSLAYQDWCDEVAPSPERAMQILKDNTHPGAVVLLHPTSNINVMILRDMIQYWRDEGYVFASLSSLA